MYSTEMFVSDVVDAIKHDPDKAQEQCLKHLKEAMKNPDLLKDYQQELADTMEFHVGRTPECAIKVFKFKPTDKPQYPHDHAGFWGVYGIYRGVMEMAFFDEENPNAEGWPGLRETGRISMQTGATVKIRPDQLHGVWSKRGDTLAIAIYNGDLNDSLRRIYDLDSNTFIYDRSQWQTREALGQSGGGLRKLAEEEIRQEI